MTPNSSMAMWEYQTRFRIAAQRVADDVFTILDPNLRPNVFLVGIRQDERVDRFSVCIEPEDCVYDPFVFSNVKYAARHLEAIDEEQHIEHSNPVARETHKRRIGLKACKNAVQAVLDEQDRCSDLLSFCTWPVLVNDYMVCTVVQFDARAYRSHYALERSQTDGKLALPNSLLEATTHEFFNGCTKVLREPEPASGLDIFDRDHNELIRAAGNFLMWRLARAAGESVEGLHELFHGCNALSSLSYEGADCVGRMLVAQRGHPSVHVDLSFSTVVRLSEYRAIRKLLEMTTETICLLSDSAYVYGLGRINEGYDPRTESLFAINFVEHHTWELVHAERPMMRVMYGQPRLPGLLINKEKFNRDLARIFTNIADSQSEKLWQLVLPATQQQHGTIVVVSTGAKEETERLENQGTKIDPVELTPEIMHVVTAVDGAVLIDPQCKCYGIGFILDGLASTKGTAARGARYNSAIRYVESSAYPCMAIVVSADGSIDLVPDLKAPIKRSLVAEHVTKLRNLKHGKKFEQREFNRIMSWFYDHEFYLLPKVCEVVNGLRREMERHLDPNMTTRVNHRDVVPNAEMNDSYFLSE